jgi:hypothetical protein
MLTLEEILGGMRGNLRPQDRDRWHAWIDESLRATSVLRPDESVDRLPPERLQAPVPDGVFDWLYQTFALRFPPPRRRRATFTRLVVRPFVQAPYLTCRAVALVVTAALGGAGGRRRRDPGRDSLPHLVAVAVLPVLGYAVVIGGGWAAGLPPGPWWVRVPVLVLLGNAAAGFAWGALAPLVALHHWAHSNDHGRTSP